MCGMMVHAPMIPTVVLPTGKKRKWKKFGVWIDRSKVTEERDKCKVKQHTKDIEREGKREEEMKTVSRLLNRNPNLTKIETKGTKKRIDIGLTNAPISDLNHLKIFPQQTTQTEQKSDIAKVVTNTLCQSSSFGKSKNKAMTEPRSSTRRKRVQKCPSNKGKMGWARVEKNTAMRGEV
ncbi:hypothetical protein K435DRAFT_794381 [Dendrothele bispora CBS 962.96]|uniref:Uncharacterized protein n=1 Tax=Dendrothele bispora (strain CBS 962.96) TaxID=1314807 RepID=A0A4S8MCA6_DENBC|nr:hypothetical protein K435DRAFT_794381 [Dendrothele bispora CBS 962.96]